MIYQAYPRVRINLSFLFILFTHQAISQEINTTRLERLTGLYLKVDSSASSNTNHDKNLELLRRDSPSPFLKSVETSFKRSSRVLDIGMGSGRHAVYLATLGYEVTGVDIDKKSIEQAKLKARERGVLIKGVESSIEEYKAKENSFDVILSFYFYFPNLIEKALKWLAPGGLLVIETFSKESNSKINIEKLGRGELLEKIGPAFDLIYYHEPFKQDEKGVIKVLLRKKL